MSKTYKLKAHGDADLASYELSIDYAKELNPQQLRAVTAREGAYLVIAGAGTGKTRVLTFRVAYLIETGVRPEEILLLTFSRKASQEMKKRAGTVLDGRCERVAGGTFHSFSYLLLRRYAGALGMSNQFSILDRSDVEDAIHLIRNKLGFGESTVRFPTKKTISSIFSRSVNTGLSFRKILAEDFPQYTGHDEDLELIHKFFVEYKKKKNLVDYDDLLIYLRDLLGKESSAADAIKRQYRFVMVDEFQDTNHLQMEILKRLVEPHGNIMAVGDDFQSIYGFRGANFQNIMGFAEDFPGAEILKVEENYRSTEPILSFTNQIILSASEKYEKKLFSSIVGSQKPVFIEPQSETEQSLFITQRVLELREEGVPLNRIAVLFRTGFHSNDLELALAQARIPYRKFGGFKFVETAHVKDLIAFLRILHNPLDAPAWNRVLLLIEGIGPGTSNKLVEKIVDDGLGYEGLVDDAIHKGKGEKKYAGTLIGLRDLFVGLRSKSADGQIPMPELIAKFLSFAEPLLKNHYEDYRKRLDDLRSLERIAERYQTLADFLADLSLEAPTEEGEAGAEKDDEFLTLSTIHSAKGLEWHTVFVMSLVDGYLPSIQSLESDEQIEEERRLFYVAATRAERNLYLLSPGLERPARSYFDPSSFSAGGPSRFLKEMKDFEDHAETWRLE
ncbi:MAG: ATP-dependent helicase [Spirochaetia bacterium]|nr:ATP-dependent helicase [Spirochaetia bacterium]